MKILFTGDVMLGRLVNDLLNRENYTYVWGDTLDMVRSADLSLINLECAISSKGKKWDKTFKMFHFRANPKAIQVLRTAHIDYVSLANNHVLDYGIEALIDTLDLLDKNKIAHSGAGRDLMEAIKPAVLRPKYKSMIYKTKSNQDTFRNACNVNNTSGTVNSKGFLKNKFNHRYPNDNGIRIGIVSLTDNQREWEACDKYPGINYVPINLSSSNKTHYRDRLKSCIANARRVSDIVIVASHVGPHFREFPSREYSDFAHSMLDWGADIYWGHSNHMPQGIEIYRKKIIMYDCGDFVDDYAVDPEYRNDLSFIFLLCLEEDYCVTRSIRSASNYGEYVNSNSSEDMRGTSLSNHYPNNVKDIEANRERPLLMGSIELIPTKISEFRVNMAYLEEADAAINRMVDRCDHLGTKCNVDTLRKKIVIPLSS